MPGWTKSKLFAQKSRRLSLLLFLVAASFLAVTSHARAFDLGIGLAAIDTMNDQAQPAASARIGWTEGLYSQVYYWGKDFGPVSQRDLYVTLAGETLVRGTQLLFAHYGVVASQHQVNLYDNQESRQQANAPEVEQETNYNFGGVLGIAVQQRFGPVRVSLNWDSHIFFTGNQLIIFFTSARRQSLSLMLGVDL